MLVKNVRETISDGRKVRLSVEERKQFPGGMVVIRQIGGKILFLTEEEFTRLAAKKLTELKGLELGRKTRNLFGLSDTRKIDLYGWISLPRLRRN